MKEEKRSVQDITYILVRKSVKNMSLRVNEDGQIRVTAPRLLPSSFIDAFVYSNRNKIEAAVNRQKDRNAIRALKDRVFLWGKEYALVLKKGVQRLEIQPQALVFSCPDPKKDNSAALKKQLTQILDRAVRNMRQRYDGIVEEYHLNPPSIRYREMKSRWGSCIPAKGIITLNTRLIHYPEACLEYVLMHEYMHLIVPNHSQRFHQLEEYYMPDYRKRQKLLNAYPML